MVFSYSMGTIPDICHFFSTDTIFGSPFRHAKARNSRQSSINRKKYEIAHSPKNVLHRITQMTDVDFSTRHTHTHVCRIDFRLLHIWHVEKYQITPRMVEKLEITPHDEKIPRKIPKGENCHSQKVNGIFH